MRYVTILIKFILIIMKAVPNKLYQSFSGSLDENVNSSNRSGSFLRLKVNPFKSVKQMSSFNVNNTGYSKPPQVTGVFFDTMQNNLSWDFLDEMVFAYEIEVTYFENPTLEFQYSFFVNHHDESLNPGDSLRVRGYNFLGFGPWSEPYVVPSI